MDGITLIYTDGYQNNKNRRPQSPQQASKWNIFWASHRRCSRLFFADHHSLTSLGTDQLVNHFPCSQVLTRLDHLVRLLRTGCDEEKCPMLPAWLLPADRSRLKGALTAAGGSGVWSLQRCCPLMRTPTFGAHSVVFKHPEEELRIGVGASGGGCRVDLHVCVLVTAFRPLRAHVHRDCPLCTRQPRTRIADARICQRRVKVMRRKNNGDGDSRRWAGADFRLYMESCYGAERTARVFEEMRALVVYTLRRAEAVIAADRHCFEVFDFRVVLDGALRPWLVAIDEFPAKWMTEEEVCRWQADIVRVVVPKSGVPNVWARNAEHQGKDQAFELLVCD